VCESQRRVASDRAEKISKLMEAAEKARDSGFEEVGKDSFVPTVFLAVHSRIDHLSKRLALRDIWREVSLAKSFTPIFVTCMESSAPSSKLLEENATFQDILTMDCDETAAHVTVPMQLQLMRFYMDHHSNSTALMQVQDDAFVALHRVKALLQQLGNSRADHLYASIPQSDNYDNVDSAAVILGSGLVSDILAGSAANASQETIENVTELNAPLTQAGYQQVTAQKDDDAMRAFVLRYLDATDRAFRNDKSSSDSLNGFLPFYSGTQSVQSFAGLRNELSSFAWVLPKTGKRSIPASEFIEAPPRPMRRDARRELALWVNGAQRAGFNVEALSLQTATESSPILCGQRWSDVTSVVVPSVEEADVECLTGLDRVHSKDAVVDCLAKCSSNPMYNERE